MKNKSPWKTVATPDKEFCDQKYNSDNKVLNYTTLYNCLTKKNYRYVLNLFCMFSESPRQTFFNY